MEIEKTKKGGVENKLDSFIGKYRKPILAIGIVLVVVIIALCIAVVMIQRSTDSKFDTLVDVEALYTGLGSLDPESQEYADAYAGFTAAADALIASAGLDSYPGAKARLMEADAAFANMDYAEAASMYAEISAAQSGTYLAALCQMNEAACYENLGDQERALELYTMVRDGNSTFGTKASFSIGRIYAAMGNDALAEAEFATLADSGIQSEYARMAEAYLINYAD